MYNRKLLDSRFLLAELAKLNAKALMQYMHKHVPLQSFRTAQYQEKIRTAKLNPYDYICFAIATNNILLLSTGRLQRCLDWLRQQPTNNTVGYPALLHSLETLKNIREAADQPHASINQSLLLPDCYLNLQHARLSSAALASVDFRLANLRHADLSRSDLRFADFTHVKMENVVLSEADLSNASAEGAFMCQSVLINANLERANLQHAQLQSARLVNARLFHANLQHANLTAANLKKADLRCANLIHADLYRTELSEANLAGSRFFTRKMLASNQLIHCLNRMWQMLRKHPQLEMVRQHIAIDLCNEARKLNPQQCRRILQTAYHHRLFLHCKHSKSVRAINTVYGFIYNRSRNYLETSAQNELARYIPENV